MNINLKKFTILLLWISLAHSAEVDDFHLPPRELVEQKEVLDNIVNEIIDFSVFSTNLSGSCDQDLLIKNLRLSLDTNSSPVISFLVGEIIFNRNSGLDLSSLDSKESPVINNKFKLLDLFFNFDIEKILKNQQKMSKSNKLFIQNDMKKLPWYVNELDAENNIYHDLKDSYFFRSGCCAATVKVHEQLMGIDKIGHFFENSYSLYNYQKSHSLKDTLKFNSDQEEGTHGLAITGVKSYADMVANYEGHLFWKWLLDDPDPAIKCDFGKFVFTKKFNISKYINPGWNESVNCSSFSPDISKAVLGRIRNATMGKDCPISKDDCLTLKNIYPPEVGQYLIHPSCLKQQDQVVLIDIESENSCHQLQKNTDSEFQKKFSIFKTIQTMLLFDKYENN